MLKRGPLPVSLITVVLIIASISIVHFSTVNTVSSQVTGTQIGGILWDNTTWTSTNSPYIITDIIQVPFNVTLTIEPGVTIRTSIVNTGNNFLFLLNGFIFAHGTINNLITIDCGGLSLFSMPGATGDSFVDLQFCNITNGARFWDSNTGPGGHSSFNLTYSRVSDFSLCSYVFYPQGDVNIRYNIFDNCAGFTTWNSGSPYDGNVYIENNLFKNGENFFVENWAYGFNKTIVQYNTFSENTGYVLSLKSGYPSTWMNASNNYWQTTNTTLISSMIHDMNTDISCTDFITYQPILNSPDPNTPPASGPTQVSGIISSDTIWYELGSPYTFAGNVFVDEGIALTIEPGVTVSFNGYFMNIGGTLTAQGTQNNKIVFVGSEISYTGEWKGRIAFLNTSTNSTIENSEITSTIGTIIGIYDSSPIIHNNIIENTTRSEKDGTPYAIKISNGSPIITGNIIRHSAGICVSGTKYRDSVILTNNTITHNDIGIYLTYDGSSPVISENVISNNVLGIFADCMFSEVTVIQNLIINNYGYLEYGYPIDPFWTEGGGIEMTSGLGMNIRENTINNNNRGIFFRSSSSASASNITQNNIFGNTNFDVYNTVSANINATSNWWGTTNTTLIDQNIYDFYDDFNLGKVNYTPILSEFNSEAPPVLIPEAATCLVTALFLALISAVMVTLKRKRIITFS